MTQAHAQIDCRLILYPGIRVVYPYRLVGNLLAIIAEICTWSVIINHATGDTPLVTVKELLYQVTSESLDHGHEVWLKVPWCLRVLNTHYIGN